ncbi:hypothetical protein [Candidatus Nitrosocosmicus sp. FF01]|uniref:hypothetical protein n=1 Tax=Candidatus Nitrosocosmicus sp. FF01 TaxID=3397670 RepID=UPI0039E80CB4
MKYSFIVLILALGLVGFYGTNILPYSGAQMSSNMTNCVSDTINQSNYLTNHCSNTLIKTNDTITNLDCTTSTGWYVVCSWLQQDSLSNKSATQLSTAASIDGGQSFSEALQDLTNSTSVIRNLEIDSSHEYTYLKYEQEVAPNIFEVFLAESSDAGQTFDPAVQISNSSANINSSTLLVDELTGKYLVYYVIPGDDAVKVYCGKC